MGRRYFREVRLVDRGYMTPGEFTKLICGSIPPSDVADIVAASWVYIEDGGELYDADEFVVKAAKELGIPLKGYYKKILEAGPGEFGE